jgi:hypothetical protein
LGAKSLALVVLAMLAAPIAAADGVIVKSASVDYPVGSLVKDSEVLRLAAGQTVTVLDRSGAVIERRAGAYEGPSAREAAGFEKMMAALAAGPQAKSAIGGTRPLRPECGSATPLAADACIPRGIVGKTLRVTDYAPPHAGVAGQFVLESNFDGYAVCVGWNSLSEDSRFIPGGDPAHPLELSATAPVRLGLAPDASGAAMKSVSCAGVSAGVWDLARVQALQALNPNSAAIVLSSFAKLRGETIVEGRATASSTPQP